MAFSLLKEKVSRDITRCRGFAMLGTEPFFGELAEGEPPIRYNEVADLTKQGLFLHRKKS